MKPIATEQLGLLLIFLIVLILVTVVGLVLYVVSARRKKYALSDEVQRLHPPVPTGSGQVVGEGALVLVREPGSPLQVEIAGSRYRSLAEVQDPAIKRQIISAAMDLIGFTGVLSQQVETPASLEQTYSWREDVRHQSKQELSQVRHRAESQALTQAELEEQFLTLLGKLGQTAPPERPGLVNSIQHSLKPKPPEVRPHTFVDDIEQIVQRRVLAIPALHHRELHIRSDLRGAVRFEFDGQVYQTLEEIPNLTARQIISEAIKEWEETA